MPHTTLYKTRNLLARKRTLRTSPLEQPKKTDSLPKQLKHVVSTDTSNIQSEKSSKVAYKLKQIMKPKFNHPHIISPLQRVELLNNQLDKAYFGFTSVFCLKKEKNSYGLIVSDKKLNKNVQSNQCPSPRTDLF